MKGFGLFRLDTVNQCLWRQAEGGEDQRIPLRPTAYAILQYVVDHAGRLVSQDELLDAVWPDTYVQPEVLKRHILDIRSALGDDPKHPLFIETVPRRGYQFVAQVDDDAPGKTAEPIGPQPGRMVGRERVLDVLAGYLGRACEGQRQIVFVSGEAG